MMIFNTDKILNEILAEKDYVKFTILLIENYTNFKLIK